MKIVNKLTKIIQDKKVQNLCLILEMVVSVLVFITLSGGTGVDYDEAFSWDVVVNNNVRGILAATAADVHPPLYYLIVKVSFAIFGESLRVMLWTSLFPVILGMVLSAALIRKRWGFQVAVLLNLAYGFAPFMLYYNLNLRMYSWMDLFVLGVILVCYEIVCEGKGKGWHYVILFLCSIMAVYTQYFAVLPIVVCYLWLFIYLVRRKDKSGLIGFLTICVLDVISYIPWLLYGMQNMGVGSGTPHEEYRYYFKPTEVFNALFDTNLENGDVMAMILFIVALIAFMLFLKRFSVNEKSFIVMLYINIVFCWFFSQWLGSLNGHFFTPRYVIYCLVFTWLLFAIIFERTGAWAYIAFSLWTLELSFSSYLVERSWEYDTTPLMPHTMEFISENIDADAVMVYDFDRNFDIIYRYYMPGHEYVYFEDLNLSEMSGKTFWVIKLGGADFSPEDISDYGLEVENYPGMGFMGMERFDFLKVTVE